MHLNDNDKRLIADVLTAHAHAITKRINDLPHDDACADEANHLTAEQNHAFDLAEMIEASLPADDCGHSKDMFIPHR